MSVTLSLDGVNDSLRSQIAPFIPVIEKLQASSAERFGLADPSFTVEAYIPRFYSDVLRLAVRAAGAAVHIYVKIAKLAGETHEKVAATTEVVYGAMEELYRDMLPFDGLSAVRPVACFPEHRAIVTEEAPGQVLLRLLEQDASWWPSAAVTERLTTGLFRVGQWLRRFHSVWSVPHRQIDTVAMREYLDVRLRLLTETHRVLSTQMREQILAAFDARAVQLREPELALVPVHADCCLGNIVVDDSRVTVLDFSVPGHGAVYHDVAHLYMQLDLLTAKPNFRPTVVRALQDALMRGFDPSLATTHPLFELLLLQHIACHLTGIVQHPTTPVARVYNAFLVRRHRRWLSAFASRNGREGSSR